jgi:hypothetical protein
MGRQIATAKRGCLLGAVAALACGLATGAPAEVRVEGNSNALRVTASGDALSDVLSAFGARLPVKFRTSVPLDAEINGAYSGSLSQVVSRLLDGYNYVIKQDSALTEILVFGKRGEAAVSPKPVSAGGVLSRWR